MINLVKDLKGKAGIIIKCPSSDNLFKHNKDEVFSAASLIKLPMMYTAYKLAELGEIDLETTLVASEDVVVPGTGHIRHTGIGKEYTIDQLIYLMITASDNTATNMLIDFLTYDRINELSRKIGMRSTIIARKMQDFEALKRGIDNLISPSDAAIIYGKFLDSQEFTSKTRQKILKTLADQERNNKIPKLLPDSIIVMHKTGELPNVEHDAGIVEKEGKYLILVIMTSELENNEDGINFISTFAKRACVDFLS